MRQGASPTDAAPVARVVGLAGSLRASSSTRSAVRCALRGAEADGAQVQLLELAAYELPFLGREQEATGRAAVEHFLGDLRVADGIILGSPELHGSMSGVLKNALDVTDRELFEGKMLGPIGIAGGRMGASETPSHLRTVAHFARLHKCGEHMRFMKEWEGAGSRAVEAQLVPGGHQRQDDPARRSNSTSDRAGSQEPDAGGEVATPETAGPRRVRDTRARVRTVREPSANTGHDRS